MTLNLMRGLALWCGCLALVLISVLPLSPGAHAGAVAIALALVVAAWVFAGRRSAGVGASLSVAAWRSLPGAAYGQPVVLVCGEHPTLFGPHDGEDADGADGANGADEPSQIRLTPNGCYISVPAVEALPLRVASLLAARPQWRTQLSVMCIVNPSHCADTAELAGQLRALEHQLSIIRRRALALPLWVVSYQPAQQGTRYPGAPGLSRGDTDSAAQPLWFSWEAGSASARVRGNGSCVSVEDWQRQGADPGACAERLRTAVQMNASAAWLAQFVAPYFTRTGRHHTPWPVAYVIHRGAGLPRPLPGNVWQQWLQAKTALRAAPTLAVQDDCAMAVPDPLLELLPRHNGHSAVGHATVVGLWLAAFTVIVAMSSSARQNTLLLRQVGDDLRRFASITHTAGQSAQAAAQRDAALNVLHQDARRLDDYYRYGEPASLGLGLYRAEQLRVPVWAAIGNYRPPAEMTARAPEPVRLDTLSLFHTGSAELKADSTQILINALVDIKARPGWLIVVTGHTDATGSAQQNLRLSRDRAASVRDWMQRMGGIPGSCFAVQGFGATQPIASNDTEQGRRANRRVDIRLVPEEGACGSLSAGAGLANPSPIAAFEN
jgi:outer membrane protein OmpA-like peptidoglycan-associated protein